MAWTASTARTGAPAAVAMWMCSTTPSVAASDSVGPFVVLPIKLCTTSDVGGGASASPRELPFRRELSRSAQARRPGSSPTGASQLRDSAGLRPDFAGSTPAGEYVPGLGRIRRAVDGGG